MKNRFDREIEKIERFVSELEEQVKKIKEDRGIISMYVTPYDKPKSKAGRPKGRTKAQRENIKKAALKRWRDKKNGQRTKNK